MSDAPVITDAERDELRRHGIMLTSLGELAAWGRSKSVWPLQFGLACCAIEMIAAATARFDIARFGAEKVGDGLPALVPLALPSALMFSPVTFFAIIVNLTQFDASVNGTQ